MVLVAEDPFELAVTKQHCSKLACRIQLLHLCQQIRNEAHDIFWAENKFQITAEDSIANHPFICLERFGHRQTLLIEHLTIAYRVSEDYRARVLDDFNAGMRSNFKIYFYQVELNIRHLIWCGIPVSSIKLVTPPDHDSARSGVEPLLAKIHEEFNAVVKQTLRTPGWEQQKKLNANQYQEIMTAPSNQPVKVLNVGDMTVVIIKL